MTHPTLNAQSVTEFAIGLAAPLLAIAAYAAHVGAPVGHPMTILAAVIAGFLLPFLDRLGTKPTLRALGLAEDKLLQFAARSTANAALGLVFAVWLIKPVS